VQALALVATLDWKCQITSFNSLLHVAKFPAAATAAATKTTKTIM
jgi:hypothetical protein